MKSNSPCFGCEMVGCGAYHDKCEKYIKYITEVKDLNKKIYEEKRLKHDELQARGLIKWHYNKIKKGKLK